MAELKYLQTNSSMTCTASTSRLGSGKSCSRCRPRPHILIPSLFLIRTNSSSSRTKLGFSILKELTGMRKRLIFQEGSGNDCQNVSYSSLLNAHLTKQDRSSSWEGLNCLQLPSISKKERYNLWLSRASLKGSKSLYKSAPLQKEERCLSTVISSAR